MVLDRFGERAEDHAGLGERRLEGRGDRDRVDDRVDGDIAEQLLLVQRDAELVEHLADLGIDVVHAVEHRLLPRRRPVADRLVVDRGDLQLGPVGLVHLRPRLVRGQPPLEQPLGLVLLRRDQPDDVLVQPRRRDVGVELGAEAVLVAPFGQFLDFSQGFAHRGCSPRLDPSLVVLGVGHATDRRAASDADTTSPWSVRFWGRGVITFLATSTASILQVVPCESTESGYARLMAVTDAAPTPTQRRVLEALKRLGEATADELAVTLEVSSSAVRQHLGALRTAGLIDARQERGHAGRPADRYRATDANRAAVRDLRRVDRVARTRRRRASRTGRPGVRSAPPATGRRRRGTPGRHDHRRARRSRHRTARRAGLPVRLGTARRPPLPDQPAQLRHLERRATLRQGVRERTRVPPGCAAGRDRLPRHPTRPTARTPAPTTSPSVADAWLASSPPPRAGPALTVCVSTSATDCLVADTNRQIRRRLAGAVAGPPNARTIAPVNEHAAATA